MTCETFQQTLTASSDPRRLPAELATHARGCSACARFRHGLLKLDRLVPQVAVPASPPEVRAAFVAGLATADLPPIIERRQPARRDSTGTLTALWAAREQWQYAAGVAAMLAVGVGLWWVSTGSRPAGAAEVSKPRHELLSKEVRLLAALTKAETPGEKVAVWSGWAADITAEAKAVHKVAGGPEMAMLSHLYARTLDEGVIKQAASLPPSLTPAERLQALADADAKLQDAEVDAEVLAKEAPPASRGALKKIAGTAKAARARLQSIIRTGAQREP